MLVSVDVTGKKQVPILAETVPTLENGGISKDGLTITYHLRHGIVWHDGTKFTSADVAFSWRAIMNPSNNVIGRTGYELVKSVDTPDPTTAVFHMKRRFSPAVNTLFGESDTPYAVVPQHLLASLHDINAIPFNSNPVGTGPFKISEWVRGDHLTLVANDAYFLGKPKLRRIVVRFIPDENTEINQLRTHDVDWQFEASPQEYQALKTIPGLNVYLQQTNQYERVEMNTLHPPLDDVRVRQAIAYVVDRKKLVDDLTFGSAVAADQDLPPFMWAHATDITRYSPDLGKAKALLAQAGYAPGPDGMLVRNGRKLVLELAYTSTNTTRRAGVVQIQSMLAAVGIRVEVKPYQGALLFAAAGEGGILTGGKYDLGWAGWVSGIDPDNSSVVTCAARPPNGNNSMFYCNARMDVAEARALDRFDVPTRKRAYAEIERDLTHDEPQLPLWWPRQLQPVNVDLMHFSPNPVVETWNAYLWDI
ncbi:MAG: peptide ABC transporter substrate-binding protein [Candidatus Eremiobacteraeota bacterium]|nr:peptide ABC transporter substrate-binding protein [Candidatus Eremiobacteraeota bacterium]